MSLSTAFYTVGSNQPLNHARILYAPITGTVSATGTNGSLALNDFTFQRWACGSLPATWTLTTAANAQIDTLVIAAHNLFSTGCQLSFETAATVGGAFTQRGASGVLIDDDVFAFMFNNSGSPYTIRQLRITVTGGASTAAQIGIIRAGVALQMERPVYGGVQPIGLNRIVETRHAMSESGQWLGRTIQRQARRTTMEWQNLTAAWYRSTFEPFSMALPQTPFALIQNPQRMRESVAWCWTDQTPTPSNMGVRDLMQVSLDVTGYLG